MSKYLNYKLFIKHAGVLLFFLGSNGSIFANCSLPSDLLQKVTDLLGQQLIQKCELPLMMFPSATLSDRSLTKLQQDLGESSWKLLEQCLQEEDLDIGAVERFASDDLRILKEISKSGAGITPNGIHDLQTRVDTDLVVISLFLMKIETSTVPHTFVHFQNHELSWEDLKNTLTLTEITRRKKADLFLAHLDLQDFGTPSINTKIGGRKAAVAPDSVLTH